MTVVEQLRPWDELLKQHPDWRRDALTLPWEDRCRSHGKHTTDGGVRFGLSLKSGSVLASGDGLALESECLLVEIREAEESLYRIVPETPVQGAYLAYQIGNRHLTLMIRDDALHCLAEPAARLLLEQLSVSYTEVSAPFTPALKLSGHTHSH